jgi:hypothetical protein
LGYELNASSFEPLLRAEFDEEEQLFHIRLEEWSIDRLKREGYALGGLRGSIRYQPRSRTAGCIVTFSRTGKTATALPLNRFSSVYASFIRVGRQADGA